MLERLQRIRGLILVLLGLAVPVLAGAQRPAGGPFPISLQAGERPADAHVAMNARGDFAVVWVAPGAQNGQGAVFVRRFAPGGAPVTGEIPIPSEGTSPIQETGVVMMDDGGFTVLLAEGLQIVARRYGPDGSFLSGRIVADRADIEFAAAARGGHGFILAWTLRDGALPIGSALFVQAFGADGTPATPARRVALVDVGLATHPAVAVGPDGGFVVAWEGSRADPRGPSFVDLYRPLAQRYDAAGNRLGGRIAVDAEIGAFLVFPRVAVDAAGDFLVVWSRISGAGLPARKEGIYARRFDADGAPLSGVRKLENGRNEPPLLAIDRAGSFVVGWQALQDIPVKLEDIFVQGFTADGDPLRPPLRVNRPDLAGFGPSLAGDANGNFVVVWSDLRSLLGQRFRR
ncbi:MAG TPA: hypothetical protein VGP73_19275 [Thermoanaerobaculia bacterium]